MPRYAQPSSTTKTSHRNRKSKQSSAVRSWSKPRQAYRWGGLIMAISTLSQEPRACRTLLSRLAQPTSLDVWRAPLLYTRFKPCRCVSGPRDWRLVGPTRTQVRGYLMCEFLSQSDVIVVD